MEAVLDKKTINELNVKKGNRIFAEGFLEGIQPIPDENIWQWADKHVWLAGGRFLAEAEKENQYRWRKD